MVQLLDSAMWFVYGTFIVLGISAFLRNLRAHHHHDPAMTAAAHRAAEGERRRFPTM